ncbi:MAG: carboxypeptidase-like regulatory domain-containing protein [Spirosomataceae bacterium]
MNSLFPDKYKFFLITFCLIFSFNVSVFSQLKGKILSKTDKKSLAFATIYLKNANIGIHSNEDGEFELNLQGVKRDSVYIQLLGYRTLQMSLDKAIESSIFYLEESPLILLPVTIQKKKKIRSLWKGATEAHRGFVFGQMGGSTLRESALFIPNDEKQIGYLKEVSFYVVRFGKHKTPFRVRIYEPDDNNMPGKDLLIENVITRASRPNHYCTVDVSKYNIPFGLSGIFISMEWLNLSDKKYFYQVKYRNGGANRMFYGQQIGLNNEFEDLQGRVRINNGPWKTMTAGYASPMFRAKIDFYDE